MLINNENLFLIILGLVWITGAVLQDFKRREVDNVWNFSLIAFVLSYRAALAIHNLDIWFLLNGLIGVLIFFILGNLFYYARLFAGGDAKLVISLGAILPLSYDWISNLKIFGVFIVGFLVIGSAYVLLWAIFLIFQNLNAFKKEFAKQWKIYRKMFYIFLLITFVWILITIVISQTTLIVIGFIILLFPVLFIFAKSVEEACMIKAVNPGKLTEGEWLYDDIKVNGKKIRADWEGVSKEELALIKKKYVKKVLIKQGVPFTPSFLGGFILLLIVLWRYSIFFN